MIKKRGNRTKREKCIGQKILVLKRRKKFLPKGYKNSAVEMMMMIILMRTISDEDAKRTDGRNRVVVAIVIQDEILLILQFCCIP